MNSPITAQYVGRQISPKKRGANFLYSIMTAEGETLRFAVKKVVPFLDSMESGTFMAVELLDDEELGRKGTTLVFAFPGHEAITAEQLELF